MKRLVALAVGGFLSIGLISTPYAAPAGTSAPQASPPGLKNSKKAMQSMQERQKKVREAKKRAYAKRQQAQVDKKSP